MTTVSCSSEKTNSGERHIELRAITRVYREGDRERAVLRDVSLCINRGEFAALLGPSGSGKSTLLNLISGIDVPTSGEVFINSLNLTALSEKKRTLYRRNNIGFVFQFFNLIPTLTVEENLMLPLELTRRTGKVWRQKALDLLDTVGLADRANSFPDRLSGGEQQRVAIARALVHDPPVILADEPTGNLDADTGVQVIEILDGLVRQTGKTMVIVTHSPEVVSLADRVYSIQDAQVTERSVRFAP